MEYTEKWAEKNAVNALPLPSYSSFYRIAMDLSLIHIFDPIYFMNEPQWFRPVYILSETWQFTGWTAII